MAYSPSSRGGSSATRCCARSPACTTRLRRRLRWAWVLRRDDVCAIPRASRIEHTNENRAAADIQLDQADLAQLDQEFPRPERVRPLEML